MSRTTTMMPSLPKKVDDEIPGVVGLPQTRADYERSAPIKQSSTFSQKPVTGAAGMMPTTRAEYVGSQSTAPDLGAPMTREEWVNSSKTSGQANARRENLVQGAGANAMGQKLAEVKATPGDQALVEELDGYRRKYGSDREGMFADAGYRAATAKLAKLRQPVYNAGAQARQGVRNDFNAQDSGLGINYTANQAATAANAGFAQDANKRSNEINTANVGVQNSVAGVNTANAGLTTAETGEVAPNAAAAQATARPANSAARG